MYNPRPSTSSAPGKPRKCWSAGVSGMALASLLMCSQGVAGAGAELVSPKPGTATPAGPTTPAASGTTPGSASGSASASNRPELSITSVDTAAYRLDRNVLPSRYELTLTPNFETMSFSADLRIEVTVAKPTRQVILHSKELVLESIQIKQGTKAQVAKPQAHEASDTVTLTVDKPLKAGKAELLFHYKGTIQSRSEGLHGETIQGERYAVTELEPDGARLVMPCFDEPSFKASFLVSLVIDRNMEAVSNGRKRGEKIDAVTGMKTVQFEDSPIMSTYLLTLAFGDLVSTQKVTSNGIPIAMWSLKSKLELQNYALNTMTELLPLIEHRFGITYPYPKLELISVPQYQGAMENTAAMIFDDSALLDPKRSSPQSLRSISEVIAHEMAHQWFGNLVTTAWWDDLWLNEAFATWLATRIIDEWKPEWKSGLDDVVQMRIGVMSSDAMASSHAIRSPVLTTEDASEKFDDVTYSKGALILTMLERYLGPEVFWTGVRQYLDAHRQSVATASELWASLERASLRPVSSIATTWFDQPGYPIVDVEQFCENGKTVLQVSQKQFIMNPPADFKNTRLWSIPMPLRFQTSDGARTEWRLLEGRTGKLLVDSAVETTTANRCGWVYPNAEQLGFYRLRFTPQTLQNLLAQSLNTLEVSERSALLSDQAALVMSGEVEATQWLNMLASFKKETSRHVLETLFNQYGRLTRIMPEGPGARAARRYAQALAEPYFTRLGWEPRANESDEETLLRPLVISQMVNRDNRLLRKEARARLLRTLDDPQANPLDNGVFYSLVSLVAYDGDTSLYERYLKEWRQRTAPREKASFLFGLTRFNDPALMERTLQLGLTDEAKGWLRLSLIVAPLWQEESQAARWKWIQENFATLTQKLPPEMQPGLISATSGFCTPELRKEVETFFQDPAHSIEDSTRTLHDTLESIDQCIALRSRLKEPIESWLLARYPEPRSQTGSSAEPKTSVPAPAEKK